MLVVKAKCSNGHEQTIRVREMSRECAEAFAGILDGTSDFYLYPPGPESDIGKCGICREPFKATVEDDAK